MVASCRTAEPFSDSSIDERLTGGGSTVFDKTSKAFSNPSTGLTGYDPVIYATGNAQFGHTFVTSPAAIHSGLGPLYNITGNTSSHQRSGIRPTAGEAQS